MTRLLAYVSLIATVIFSLIVFALLFIAPDIDPLQFGISFYALTKYGFLIGLAIVLVGISGMELSFALWPTTTTTPGRIGLLLLIAWGLASFLAALFPVDAPGSPPTPSGSIHNLAGLSFLLITPALLLIELARPAGSDPVRPRTISFWLAWLLPAVSVLVVTFNGPLHSLGIGGAIQRLYWLVLVIWLLSKAFQVLRHERHRESG
jgi:hypothetical protein